MLQFFRLASVGGVVKPKKKPKAKTLRIEESKTQTEDQTEDEQDLMLDERQDETPPRSEEIRDDKYKQVVPMHKEVVKRHIEEMIYNLPDIPYTIFNPKVVKIDEIPNFRQKKEPSEEKDKSEVSMGYQGLNCRGL